MPSVTHSTDFNLDQDEVYLNDGNDVADLTKSSGVFAYGGNGDDFLSYEGIGQAILDGGEGEDLLLGNTNGRLAFRGLGRRRPALAEAAGTFSDGGFGADTFRDTDAVESSRNSIDVIRDFLA